ncbi:MAG TPA: alpha/beta hydrolase [Rhizomicrobium sp.]|jgi:acetyl esterase
MLLEPLLKAFLDQVDAEPGPRMWQVSPVEARGMLATFMNLVGPKKVPIGEVRDLEAPGPGGAIRLRSYTPASAASTVLPTLIFFHGGGFVIGDLDTHDGICRLLANESGARVIAVDYRLSPEHKFPAAVEDARAVFRWIGAHSSGLGVDDRRLAVGGDSAGGALAAIVAQTARTDSGPKPAFQLLLFPVTDYAADTRSRRDYAEGYFLDRWTIAWFFENYVPRGTDLRDPLLSPLHAKDLRGLPPAYLLTAGCDPLHDEGLEYAERLRACGVPVAIEDYPGLVHDFIYLHGVLPQAGQALRNAALALRTALRTPE